MSNETKQDVFEYYLDMIKALKDPLAAECVNEAQQRYAAALPDDLPVIPKDVSEYIKDSDNLDLLVALTIASKGYKHSDLWIATHQNVFSSAWLDGVWRVEESGEIVKLEAEK